MCFTNMADGAEVRVSEEVVPRKQDFVAHVC